MTNNNLAMPIWIFAVILVVMFLGSQQPNLLSEEPRLMSVASLSPQETLAGWWTQQTTFAKNIVIWSGLALIGLVLLKGVFRDK